MERKLKLNENETESKAKWRTGRKAKMKAATKSANEEQWVALQNMNDDEVY